MEEPDRNTKLEARVLAAYARRQIDRKLEQDHAIANDDYEYGFTIVCNNCGSMNGTHETWVGVRGYYIKCPDCGQKVYY